MARGGGGIVASLGHVEIDHVAIRTVDRGVTKLGMRRQRVVIVFDNTVGDGSLGSLYLKSLAYGESPRAVGCTVTAVLSSKVTQSYPA